MTETAPVDRDVFVNCPFDDEYRYQAFLSDIAGQDIRAHGNDGRRIATHIRDWLRDSSQDASIPGGNEVFRWSQQFQRDLPQLCRSAKLSPK